MSNYFTELQNIDVSDNVESKGKFSYLSWAYAIAELSKRHPEAAWEVKRFPMREGSNFMVPYLRTDCGNFVEVEVTVNSVTRGQIHPILNHQNKPVAEPNSFEINTSIQRALVKAIALHGLGLYIYAGEDLPPESKKMKEIEVYKKTFDGLIKANDPLGMALYLSKLDKDHGEFTISNDLYNSFPDGEKVKGKDIVDEMVKTGTLIQSIILEAIEDDDALGLKENIEDITKTTKTLLWNSLTKDQQDKMTIMLSGEEHGI